jgi:metalloendopeptidase OMA1, mitochondrial
MKGFLADWFEAYVFPNDSYECERMELQGLVMTELLGGKWFLAPISQEGPPQRMLDIGTGTGIWALEMGDRFPEAKVIGIDLSPIQPTAVPSNVHFYVQDA